MTRGLVIIGYHEIEPTQASSLAPGAGVRYLRQQLEQLRRTTNVVPLGSSLRTLFDGGPLPPRAVSITFDDGYRDALDVVAPLLKHYDLPATFFVCPGIISRECSAWWERLSWAFAHASRQTLQWGTRTISLRSRRARNEFHQGVLRHMKELDRSTRDAQMDEIVRRLRPIGEPRYEDLFLDLDDSRALARRGFEIGSHSMFHAVLARENVDNQRKDLARSRQLLQEQLEVPVDLLAYPHGTADDYSNDTIEAARDAGYSGALTTIRGGNRMETSPYELRRFIVQLQRAPHVVLKAIAQVAAATVRNRLSQSARRPASNDAIDLR